jgi:hypothetical protein
MWTHVHFTPPDRHRYPLIIGIVYGYGITPCLGYGITLYGYGITPFLGYGITPYGYGITLV